MPAARQKIEHPIPPTYDENSTILILGSFPSVKTREYGYFYGHPQNRFWRVMAALYGEEVPEGKEERRAFLLRNGVAAWDVIASCTIVGSSDSSIRDVTVNDLRPILSGCRKDICQRQDRRKNVPPLHRAHARNTRGMSALHQSGQRRLFTRTPYSRVESAYT